MLKPAGIHAQHDSVVAQPDPAGAGRHRPPVGLGATDRFLDSGWC